MTKNPPSRRLQSLLSVAAKEIPSSRLDKFEPLLKHYYKHVAPELFSEFSPKFAVAIADRHIKFANRRPGVKPLIRVYNTDEKGSGGTTSNTVVELVVENMPFIVDSIRMELNRQGQTILAAIHPVFDVVRDKDGKLKKIIPSQSDSQQKKEALIHIQIERLLDAQRLTELEQALHDVLRDVRYAVQDWGKMRQQVHSVVDSLSDARAANDVDEVRQFLSWLDERNFTFLGCQRLELHRQGKSVEWQPVKGTALGILKSKRFALDLSAKSVGVGKNNLLLITKSIHRSTVHRPAHLDYIAVRELDGKGQVIAETRFLGLYTSMAYRRNPNDVPIIRKKIAAAMSSSGLEPESHIGKAYQHILDTYPRDELFQIDVADLTAFARSILYLGDHQQLKLFVRDDPLKRFVSCIVYVPRDHYDTEFRLKMSDVICDVFNSTDLDFIVKLTEESFARIEYFVRTDAQQFPRYDAAELELTLEELSRTWADSFKQRLLSKFSEAKCATVLAEYHDAFPVSYQQDFSVEDAIVDTEYLQRISTDNELAVNLYQNQAGELQLKLYKASEPIAPSDSLPILECMGVKVLQETPYKISMSDGQSRWVHNHTLQYRSGELDITQVKQDFEDSFSQTWSGQTENDGLNELVLCASLSATEVSLVRAYCKYLLQAGLPYSQSYMESALIRNEKFVVQLVKIFNAQLDPSHSQSDSKLNSLNKKFLKALDNVPSLDDDRILRNFLALVGATLRTNFFQENKPYISFKFCSADVLELPDPRPEYEIFVYSPKVEGVHLRAGKVARGGLRWSDRREDFRTEVLGLVKAQKVKNAVIVPTGAKGGFVVKQPPADRDALLKEGISCYRQFISGLLDITDNVVKGKIVPPKDVVRRDADDPYLVVAADKGTASFSDIANEVAIQYGFWMGDAFASGGSKGYDHKKMGITAAGAWESVKLHFRDLGKDIQKKPFTVIGIGDMSGDVFGNGMLLSRQTKLVGAFNHLHIFLDPDPNPAASYKERQRLFKLPRSNWADYNSELISAGGGVYSRSDKSIKLSKAVQKLLDTDKSSVAPNALISLMLKAPVELLWNGGIGTYVKASHEQHAEVGDRANDSLRVDADCLRCKVIGEGGNLGITQDARVEYALNGGRVDSDFIHNAGGVDCSDHEVNIKILLNQAINKGLLTEKQRVKLLEQMTNEVSELVLYSNYWQTLAITLIEQDAPDLLEEHARYIRELESEGLLQRQLENLPDDETITERKAAGHGLTRPEIAVLLSYCKIIAEDELADSELWNDSYFAEEICRYFPMPIRKKFPKLIFQHPLRTDILAMFIVNRMVNRMGCTFTYRLQQETGAELADITRCYSIAWEVFGLRELWAEVAALDNKIAAVVQNQMMREVVRLVDRASKWLLQNRKRGLPVRKTIDEYSAGAQSLMLRVPQMLQVSEDEIIKLALASYREQGVSEELSLKVVGMDALYCTFDVVDISRESKFSLDTVADTYFTLSGFLNVYWLRVALHDFTADSHWQDLARKSQIDDLYRILGMVTSDVLRVSGKANSAEKRIAAWQSRIEHAVSRYLRITNELKASEHIDLAMSAVAIRELQYLYQVSSAHSS